jgi:K(+)-stimulated pyrophosphate-energized sodium pump
MSRKESTIDGKTYRARAPTRTRPPSSATPWAIPFKDTSGPSLNILLKLMSVVALVIAPLLGFYCSSFRW